MEKLERKLDYSFKDRKLLEKALTHSSYANEHRKSGAECNERLEFLGDSILGMAVAEYLYINRPDIQEGQMTKLRAEMVCEQNLVKVAETLELGDYLILGNGEELGGGRKRPSILADAVEAVIAAVYLDGGREPSTRIISRYILVPFGNGDGARISDYKTALQEFVQKSGEQTLSYRLTGEEGPDHKKVFTVEVRLNDKPAGAGRGNSKKEAEQAAAKAALEVLMK